MCNYLGTSLNCTVPGYPDGNPAYGKQAKTMGFDAFWLASEVKPFTYKILYSRSSSFQFCTCEFIY